MKKKMIIISISIIIIITLVTTLSFYNKIINYEIKHRSIMESSFFETMIVKQDATLYKKVGDKYTPVGQITTGITLYLKFEKVITKEDRYYKIEDTPYYIDYKHLEKTEDIKSTKTLYIPFQEEVITANTHTLTLYKEDKLKIHQTSKNHYQIVAKEKDNYLVLFQNRIWTLNKDEIEKIEPTEEEKIEPTKTMSVILIKKSDKIKVESLLSAIKEQQTITIEDYQKWSREEIRLKKSFLLLTEDDNIHQQIISSGLTSNLVKNVSKEWTQNNIQSNQKEEKPSLYIWDATSAYEDITKIINGTKLTAVSKPIESPYATSIPVLNYHFFYDGTNGNPCKENICLDSRKLEDHLKYLKDNNFKTLTISEYREWMYGKVELPKKSVLITIDDGAMGTSKINGNVLIPMLEKYKMNATLFLITAWWDKKNYESSYLNVESHGYDIHTRMTCNEKKTSKGACLSKEELKIDLKKSIDLLGKKNAFCYPFYISTDSMIESIKESGFALGFVGGSRKSTRTNNKYKIPRYPIYETTTIDQFKTMIN